MTGDDDRLAHDLATEAGQRLLYLRRRSGFGDAAALRAAGDRLSHEFLTAALASRRPSDAILSEEGKDNPARLAASRVWILDPLDGTREFGEVGRTDWAVHVALWQRVDPATGLGDAPGEPTPWGRGRLAVGAVALPAEGQTYSTLWAGQAGAAAGCAAVAGATAEGVSAAGASAAGASAAGTPAAGAPAEQRWPSDVRVAPSAGDRCSDQIDGGSDQIDGGSDQIDGGSDQIDAGGKLRLVVSRTRPPAFVGRLAAEIGAALVPLGSAGAKIISVLSGAADAYVHAGGQYEWDSAAPVAVVQAAGLHAFAYNQPDPRLPDILVCRFAMADLLLAAIARARAAEDSESADETPRR